MKNTDRAVSVAGQSGFTMIELLVAMVLFAVGLMALQGLSLVAVKSVGFAERSTRAAEAAGEWLEDGLTIVRRNERPRPFSCAVPGIGQVTRTVEVANPNLPRIIVTVTPESRGIPAAAYTVRSSVYLDVPLSTTVSNAPIPSC